MTDRRTFLQKSGKGLALLACPSTLLSFQSEKILPLKKAWTFGIVADVHHGMIPDTEARLATFMEEAMSREVDFIIQLGDFCMANSKSDTFLQLWNQFKGPKYHVLGNHDMDLHSKTAAMDYWEMPYNYYSFDRNGIHFIVLDANFLYQAGKYIDYNKSNFYVDDAYRTFITDEQIEWLDAELAATSSPTIIFSHQSLWHYQWGVKNRLAVQQKLEKHKEKIICCFNGHNHIDYHHIQNGIHYLEINSMSYQWLGEKYQAKRYDESVHEQYKWLAHTAPYQDPLYAFATLSPKGKLKIEGVRSQWLAPSPHEIGLPKQVMGNEYSPVISDYEIKFLL